MQVDDPIAERGFPRVSPPLKEPSGNPHPELNGGVLIVDDRDDKRLAIEAIVREINPNIVHARSGREALSWLLKRDFSVILLDVRMPVMDGFETAALIRQRPRFQHTPIIFVTAADDAEMHSLKGYSLGAVDYIVSPIIPDILRAKVSVFVDLYRKTELVKRQAEERATLIREQAARTAAEAAQRRLSFLNEATRLLVQSLDFRQTLFTLAQTVVPQYATCAFLLMPQPEGRLEIVASTADGPEREVQLEPLAQVLQNCDQLHHVATNHHFLAYPWAVEKHAFAPLPGLGAEAILAVPIKVRGHGTGVFCLLRWSPHGRFLEEDLLMTEELVQRAAIALENAMLYAKAATAFRDAERANRTKDHFLAMLSHELRTPLTPVVAEIETIEEDSSLADPVKASIEMIKRNVEMEARLIDDLLDLTRVSKGKVRLDQQNVDPHALLHQSFGICRKDCEQKNLRMEWALNASRASIYADPARLQQIFWNLIKNAAKFTPDGGRISISTSIEDDQFVLEVRDSGIGIEPKMLARIFEAFEQGKHNAGGLGLGLAITKPLVELHGGTIRASSEGLGQGAQFRVTFPLSHPPAEEQPAPPPVPVPVAGVNCRILLVDDHQDTNLAVAKILRRKGFEVETAASAQEAIEKALAGHFDILLSDIGLPDSSGLDLMKELRSKGIELPGIAFSGFGMEEDVQRSLEAGFAHHFTKPVDLKAVVKVIQEFGLN